MTGAAPSNGRHAEETAREVDVDECAGLPSTSLPVIDIGPLLSPSFDPSSPLSPQALEAAEAIAAACLKSRGKKALGFFYATGHGISEEAIEKAHAAAAALWDSPEEVRASLDARRSPLSRGYLGLGALEHTCTRAELATLAKERLGEEEEEAKGEAKGEGSGAEGKGAGAAGDLKQSFAFGCERDESDPSARSPMHGPNQWPGAEAVARVPALRGFRAAAEDFRRLGLEAARAVARGLSLALTTSSSSEGEEGSGGSGGGEGGKRGGGDPSTFEAALSNPAALTVMLRYPPLPDVGGGGQGGGDGATGKDERNGATSSPSTTSSAASPASSSCGAHRDCGFLTIIAQRGLPGLEVFAAGADGAGAGEWVPVPPLRVDGRSTLVVNLGDLAEYWSGGRVASTLHRVEVRRRKKSDGDDAAASDGGAAEGDGVRESLILFSNANFDAPVVPTGGGGEGGGKPTTAGAYILEKLGIMWNGGEGEEKS